MELRRFYRSLTIPEKQEYVKKVGTSRQYLENHLLRAGATKIPRKEKMQALAKHSKGYVTYLDVLKHFYPEFFPEEPSPFLED